MPSITLPNADRRSIADVLTRLNQFGRWTHNKTTHDITAARRWHTVVTVRVTDDRIAVDVSPRREVLIGFGLVPIILISAVLKEGRGGLSAVSALFGMGLGWVVWRVFLMGNTLNYVTSILTTAIVPPK